MENSIEYAKRKDKEDKLSYLRNRFYTVEGQIYMDGNSLGLCSKDGEEALLNVLNVWKEQGINIWNIDNSKYFLYQYHLAELTAPLINADPQEITVANSTTVNLHQCLATFYKPTKHKYKILVDDLNFPSDRYAVDSQVKLKGYEISDAVKIVKSEDGKFISEQAVIEAMTDEVAIVFLPAMLYRSAQLLDMELLTKEAHKRGIIIGWDLCHSIGCVPHDFKKINPDFAVWCNYKYLSAGPGAIAGMYINKKHFELEPGLAGWQGNKKETQFLMKFEFEHARDAGGWQIGTQPLLSMAPLEGVLKLYKEAGIENIRQKSLALTDFLMFLIELKLTQYGAKIGNPKETHRRGGHVALEHEEAYKICLALKEKGVIPDFREPNVVRLAPVALYVSFEDVYRLVDILEEILKNKLYEQIDNKKSLVI